MGVLDAGEARIRGKREGRQSGAAIPLKLRR
jgi:hypothetical protein